MELKTAILFLTGVMMTNEQPKDANRRGQLWISPKVQSYMLIHGIIFGAYFLIIFGIAEYFFFEKFRMGIEAANLPAESPLVQYFYDYQWVKVLFVAGCSVVVLIVSALQMLYVSHRICGPIYKMTKTFNELDGKTTPGEVKFRDKDFFEELADAVNRVFTHYELRPRSDRKTPPSA